MTVIKKLLTYLKERWKVEQWWEVVVILFIFSISGMTVLYVRKEVFWFLGFDQATPLWEQAVTWLIVVFPSYQLLFLFYGFILGQFEFVWRFEKRNIRRIRNLVEKFQER